MRRAYLGPPDDEPPMGPATLALLFMVAGLILTMIVEGMQSGL